MKKLTLLVSSLLLFSTLMLPTQAGTFADVDDTETYAAGIEFLASLKIVNGNPDGTYMPEKVLNRAEMIKIIAEGAAKYYDWPTNVFDGYGSQKCFNDVPADQWYTKYICYGKEKGWVKGYDGNLYKPNQQVSFVEGLKITFMGFDLGYTENASVWYKDAVNKASEKNYIPFTIKAFNNGLKRNEMADMVARIIKSNESEAEFNAYLGARANVVVTYETIEKGEDLSKMDVVEIAPGEEEDAVEEEDAASDLVLIHDPVTFSIKATDQGFSPSTVTIQVGDIVEFFSSGVVGHWPASADHPTHKVYPGSDITKCGTDAKIFDACKTIAPGDSWSFTFTEKGQWGFHDHLNKAFTGVITVE